MMYNMFVVCWSTRLEALRTHYLFVSCRKAYNETDKMIQGNIYCINIYQHISPHDTAICNVAASDLNGCLAVCNVRYLTCGSIP